jgi:hypothetical protein
LRKCIFDACACLLVKRLAVPEHSPVEPVLRDPQNRLSGQSSLFIQDAVAKAITFEQISPAIKIPSFRTSSATCPAQ